MNTIGNNNSLDRLRIRKLLIMGGLLGMVGIFFEGLALFAMYLLIVDTAPKLAHIYRTPNF